MLSALSLHILLALTEREVGTVKLWQQIITDGGVEFELQKRNFYHLLRSLTAAGLIAEEVDRRTKYYRLTNHGRKTLRWEKERALKLSRLFYERVV